MEGCGCHQANLFYVIGAKVLVDLSEAEVELVLNIRIKHDEGWQIVASPLADNNVLVSARFEPEFANLSPESHMQTVLGEFLRYDSAELGGPLQQLDVGVAVFNVEGCQNAWHKVRLHLLLRELQARGQACAKSDKNFRHDAHGRVVGP